MIVVSNTSPLNYLVLIDAEHVLPALYRRVVIPTQVWNELRDAPSKVQQWLASAPKWLEVHKAPEHAIPAQIHVGEAAAIALAKELHAELLLIDDDDAYRYAAREGLPVTRTVGVLRDAATKQLLDLTSAFEKLKRTNFRVSQQLLDDILREFTQEQARQAKLTPQSPHKQERGLEHE